MLRFLGERGIAPGAELELIEKQPFDGPLFVRFGDDGARARRACWRGRCASRSRSRADTAAG